MVLLILVKGPHLARLLPTAVMKSLCWTEIPPVCVFQVEFGQMNPLPAIVSVVPLVCGSIICWHILCVCVCVCLQSPSNQRFIVEIRLLSKVCLQTMMKLW